MIPLFRKPEGVLPPGVHIATEREVEEKLGFSPGRRDLIEFGLKPVCQELMKMGVADVYLGGSFVTAKPSPRDVDAYVIVPFGSPPHKGIVRRQDAWRDRQRVDLYPAFEGLEGCSVEEWEGHFSHGRGNPETARGIVRLRLRRE